MRVAIPKFTTTPTCNLVMARYVLSCFANTGAKLPMQLDRSVEYISCYLILRHYTLLCASASLREIFLPPPPHLRQPAQMSFVYSFHCFLCYTQ